MGVKTALILFTIFITYSICFEFDNFDAVREIAFDIAKNFQCGCIVVFEPTNVTPSQNKFLENLTYWLARGFNVSSELTAVQVMRYNMDSYIQVYDVGNKYSLGNCFKWLNIVMTNSDTKGQLEKVSQLQTFVLSVWLLFVNSTLDQYLGNVYFKFNSNVLVVQPANNSLYNLHEVYYVGKEFARHIDPIAQWKSEEGLIMSVGTTKLRRRNLEGLVLRSGSLEDWPITTFNRGRAGQDRVMDGFFVAVWLELEPVLNFKTSFMQSLDNSPGSLNKNGEWTGLIGMAMRNEIDLILAELDYSINRLEAVQHLLPLSTTNFQVYVPLDGFVFDWWSVFRPFDSSVWLTILAWIAVGSAALHFSSKALVNARIHNSQENEISIVNAALLVLRSLSFQGSNTVPRHWTNRILFLLCYLVSSIVLPFYSAALISSLAKKSPTLPFENLKDIVNSDYKLIIPPRTSAYEYFVTAVDPDIRKIINKTLIQEEIGNFTSSMAFMCHSKERYAVFTFEAPSVIKRGEEICALLKVGPPVLPVHQSIAFTKHSPYKSLANFFILRMQETGIVRRHQKMYLTLPEIAVSAFSGPISFFDVAEIFIFLFIVNIAAIIILFIENVLYKKTLQIKYTL